MINPTIDEVISFYTHDPIQKQLIKDLRELSGYGVMDCKHALERNNWCVEDSYKYLKSIGIPVLK